MSCSVCKYYKYHCGVSLSLRQEMGVLIPTIPTNYCSFADVEWEREQVNIRKPRGIECKFELADMTCTDCGKTLKSKSDIYMTITRNTYICKKCGKKPIV